MHAVAPANGTCVVQLLRSLSFKTMFKNPEKQVRKIYGL